MFGAKCRGSQLTLACQSVSHVGVAGIVWHIPYIKENSDKIFADTHHKAMLLEGQNDLYYVHIFILMCFVLA